MRRDDDSPRDRSYGDRARSPDERSRRDRHPDDRRLAPREQAPLPAAGSICLGRVVSIREFGAFVEVEGCRTHALVHISQLAPRRVERVEDVCGVDDKVFVKILPEEKPGRLSASMKAVDQRSGAEIEGADGPRRGRGGHSDADLSDMTWGLQPLDRGDADEAAADAGPAEPKAQPNYGTTGKLSDASNTVNGVALKWSEPPDASKPTKRCAARGARRRPLPLTLPLPLATGGGCTYSRARRSSSLCPSTASLSTSSAARGASPTSRSTTRHARRSTR